MLEEAARKLVAIYVDGWRVKEYAGFPFTEIRELARCLKWFPPTDKEIADKAREFTKAWDDCTCWVERRNELLDLCR